MKLLKLENKKKAKHYIDNFSIGAMFNDDESDNVLYFLQYDEHQPKQKDKIVRLTVINDYGIKDLFNEYVASDENDTEHIKYEMHTDKVWNYVENIYNTVLQNHYDIVDDGGDCYYDEKTYNEAKEKLENTVRDICQQCVDNFTDSYYTENEDYNDNYNDENEYDDDDYDEDGYNAKKDYEDYLEYYYEEYGNEDE